MDADDKLRMNAILVRIQKLLELAQQQVEAANPGGVELFAELISEQADSLAAEAKAAK